LFQVEKHNPRLPIADEFFQRTVETSGTGSLFGRFGQALRPGRTVSRQLRRLASGSLARMGLVDEFIARIHFNSALS
jgi:hypothetical protein